MTNVLKAREACAEIIALPVSNRLFNQNVASTHAGASVFEVAIGRLREWFGRLLNRLGVPGAISTMSHRDLLTGDRVSVSVGPFFVRLTVNGRDYYFDRTTGRFNGTGMGCGE